MKDLPHLKNGKIKHGLHGKCLERRLALEIATPLQCPKINQNQSNWKEGVEILDPSADTMAVWQV
jgi:hypothetical protein